MPSAFGYPPKRTLFRRICSTAHRPPCNTRKAAGGGGEVREKEGRRQIPALSSSIPDFCPP